MLLTLDIGNSAIKGGFFEGSHLLDTFRMVHHPHLADGTWESTLRTYITRRPIEKVGITSVVPALLERLARLLDGIAHEVIVVHARMNLPFRMAYQTPQTLGTDRIAAAAAAWIRYGRTHEGVTRAVVALDAGTAVTCEVINQAGIFLGGTISAGPQLVQHALHQGTAQLPSVPLDLPHEVVGRSTQEALQVGIMYPFLDGMKGLLHRLELTLGEPPVVVATGGWGPFLHEHLDAIDHVDPHLVLRGIRVLVERQQETR